MSGFEVERCRVASRSFASRRGIPLPRPGSVISLGSEFDEGGYGSLRPVGVEAGPAPASAILAKTFRDPDPTSWDRIDGLFKGMYRALERGPIRNWDELLLGLPFALLEGRIDGEPQLVALMLDLRALGYEQWPLETDAERIALQERDKWERLELAFRFARGARLLESISFLHADLNLKNVLFRGSDCDVQIIDFDGGALVGAGRAKPEVAGKRDDFVPPEAKHPGPDRRGPVPMSLEAERWPVGLMVGLLLFGVEPYFFLGPLSAPTLDAYARQPSEWPVVDQGSEIFIAENLDSYEDWRPDFEAAPGNTRARFADFFAAGSDGTLRPTAAEWVAAMEAARQPPQFEYLRAEPDVLVESTEVLISWKAVGAESVQSKLFGTLEPEGSQTLVVGAAASFELVAVNRFGSTRGSTNSVRVVPLPRMERIPVLVFPGFRASVRVPGAIPAAPVQLPSPPRLPSAAKPPGPTPLPRGLVPPRATAPSLPSFASLWSALRVERKFDTR